MVKDKIKNEVENFKTQKWYESSRGISVIFLGIIFLLAFWHRSFVAIFILPLIYFVNKGSKIAMILAGVYAGFLTIVNIVVYVANNQNEQGNFYSSLTPIYIYLGIYVAALYFLVSTLRLKKMENRV